MGMGRPEQVNAPLWCIAVLLLLLLPGVYIIAAAVAWHAVTTWRWFKSDSDPSLSDAAGQLLGDAADVEGAVARTPEREDDGEDRVGFRGKP